MNSEDLLPVARAFVQQMPAESARFLDDEPPAEVAALLMTDPEGASLILVRMAPERAARVLVELGAAVEPAARGMDPGVFAHLITQCGSRDREGVLAHLAPALRKEVEEIVSFPVGTAGSLMDARVAVFPAEGTVEDALKMVATVRDRRISDVVAVTGDRVFGGVVRLQDLVASDPSSRVSSLVRTGDLSVQPMTPISEVVDLLNAHRLTSLPVVDLQGRVVGVLRHASLIEAAQENAATDLAKMVGASKEERALASPWVGIRSRLPWLNINLVTAFMAAGVVGLFESTIAKFTALAVLLPVVAGQSGNTGAQALAVTMRGLALREFRPSQLSKVLGKELVVGLVNGVAIAIVTAVGVYVWSQNFGLALVMLISMVGAMVAASLSGAIIPVALVKLGRDPATASSIILTTVTDIVGFSAFLGLATALAPLIASGNLPS